MGISRFFVLSFLSVFIFTAISDISVSAKNIKNDVTSYNPEKGWFWYENPPKKQKQLKSKHHRQPTFKRYTYKQLYNMYPPEFQKILKRALNQAVQNPTVDNVKQYLIIQDIARRKASEFTNVVTFVTQNTPSLNLVKDYPIARPGINTRNGQMFHDLDETLSANAGKYGLIYFYTSKCPYCNSEKSILKYFIAKFNWNVAYVNINEYPNVKKEFKIKYVPEIVMVAKNDKRWIPVGNGVISESAIERKAYMGIKYFEHKIDPRNWNLYDFQKGGGFDMSTQPFKNQVFKVIDVDSKK